MDKILIRTKIAEIALAILLIIAYLIEKKYYLVPVWGMLMIAEIGNLTLLIKNKE